MNILILGIMKTVMAYEAAKDIKLKITMKASSEPIWYKSFLESDYPDLSY